MDDEVVEAKPAVEAEPAVETVTPEVTETVTPEVTETADWRESITDGDAKKFAESSTDINHLVKRAMDMRKTLSNAIVKPGKDATPEETANYHKALGIPESADAYEFPTEEGVEIPAEVQQARANWAAKFHELKVPVDTARALIETVNEVSAKAALDTIEADKRYAAEQDAALREEWQGEDYETNKTLANRAFANAAEQAGLNLEELTSMQSKDGRLLFDDARFTKMWAVIGRATSEGTLGPVMSGDQLDSLQDSVREIRGKIQEAQDAGDSKLANKLFQQEQGLLERAGNSSIVGAQGRTA